MRRLAILFFAVVLVLSAADISGIWLGSLTGGRRNQVTDFAFQFVQKGTTLTGKVYVDTGSVPILKGTIEGDQVTFQTAGSEQEGNQLNKSIFRYTGTLKDGGIEITRERESVQNTGNAGASFARPLKQTFTIKRLP